MKKVLIGITRNGITKGVTFLTTEEEIDKFIDKLKLFGVESPDNEYVSNDFVYYINDFKIKITVVDEDTMDGKEMFNCVSEIMSELR